MSGQGAIKLHVSNGFQYCMNRINGMQGASDYVLESRWLLIPVLKHIFLVTNIIM